MKSRQFIWLLLISTLLNLNSYGNTIPKDDSKSKKVFILFRTEESQLQVQRFKEHLNYNLMLQNVSVEIETFKKSESLPQAKIFKKAYSENYDVILLIEQVAKFNIDNQVTKSIIKVGSKYKIRSYDLKSSSYQWRDHGNSNCNLSVDASLNKFTSRLLQSIDIDDKEFQFNDFNNKIVLYNNLLKELELQKIKTEILLKKIKALKEKLNSTTNEQLIMAKVN